MNHHNRPTRRMARSKPVTGGRPDAPAGGSRDALVQMGLAAYARQTDMAAETILAVITTMLTGIAGPASWLEETHGPLRLAGPSLMLVRNRHAAARMIDRLAEPVSLIERRLVQNMAGYSPDAIGCLTRGPFGGATAARFASSDRLEAVLARHARALDLAEGSDLLQQDLEFDPQASRIEAITHPGLMLRTLHGRELIRSVDDCHARTALVVLSDLELDRPGSEPLQMARDLRLVLDAVVAGCRLSQSGRAPGQVKAQAILSLTEEDLAFLSSHGTALLQRVLWLADRPSATSFPHDGVAGREFASAYQHTILELVSLRRQGREPMTGFADKLSADAFATQARDYEKHLECLAVDPGPSVRALPSCLFWTLEFLRRSLPAKQRPTDLSLIATAFSTARTLLDDHVSQMRVLMNARLVEKRQLMAGKITEEIATRGPMKLRKIVRLFKHQQKHRFEPVLAAMLRTGALILDEKQYYNTGPVDLVDAEDALAAMFAEEDSSGPARQETDRQAGQGSQKTETKASAAADPAQPTETGADTTDTDDMRTPHPVEASDRTPRPVFMFPRQTHTPHKP